MYEGADKSFFCMLGLCKHEETLHDGNCTTGLEQQSCPNHLDSVGLSETKQMDID
jgi:hypothetical protein